ncbi:MAG: tRNA (guanosine(37)-N1)-methyltransferase TrmD [bacterium]|nr:tRNA (guanosine(37)-N1)-methyltransferase TrmD [bacterium]MDZ4284671.1 tRNA (guanosine(37)-N1)-methyltransferase TrmD [Patescibacteria group bacterium]
MNFHIVTLFPEAFSSYLATSILKRALERGQIKIYFYNPRDFTDDPHRRVDRRPYGGGPGMVLQAEAILRAVRRAVGKKRDVKILILSPRGKQFDNAGARILARRYRHIILIAGHYEGIDARVKKALRAEEISIGPYVLTGGELPAMAIIDAVSRQIPGVLGKGESLEEERIASREVYTRPESFRIGKKTYRVPKILLSGDHKKIDAWKNAH